MKKSNLIAAFLSVTLALSAVSIPSTADKWTKTDKGYVYTYTDGTNAKSGWLTIGKNKYYINKNGTRKTGWMNTKTTDYYFDSTGKMITGVCTIDKADYKFDDDGKCQGVNRHFVLNEDTLCLHESSTCIAAKKINKGNRSEIDIGENKFEEYSENGYWACGKCCSKDTRNEMPKPKKK